MRGTRSPNGAVLLALVRQRLVVRAAAGAQAQVQRGQGPGLALTCVELGWDDQHEAVRTGEVDVAVVHDVGGADDLVTEELATTDRCAVVPADSELADADRLTSADTADHVWVTPVGQPGPRVCLGETDRKVVVRSPAGVATAVAATGRLDLHAEPARRFFPHPGVRYVPAEGPPAVAALAWATHARSSAVDALRAVVRESAQLEALHSQPDHARALATVS